MKKIIIVLIWMIIPTLAIAQSHLEERERRINAEYDYEINEVKKAIRGYEEIIDNAYNQYRSRLIDYDTYIGIRDNWQRMIDDAKQTIDNLENSRKKYLAEAREQEQRRIDEQRAREKAEAERKRQEEDLRRQHEEELKREADRQKREAAAAAARNKKAEADRKAAEERAHIEELRQEEARRRAAEAEAARRAAEEKRKRDYDDEYNRLAPYYRDKQQQANVVASPTRYNEMGNNINRNTIHQTISDVGKNTHVPTNMTYDSNALERLKQKLPLNKDGEKNLSSGSLTEEQLMRMRFQQYYYQMYSPAPNSLPYYEEGDEDERSWTDKFSDYMDSFLTYGQREFKDKAISFTKKTIANTSALGREFVNLFDELKKGMDLKKFLSEKYEETLTETFKSAKTGNLEYSRVAVKKLQRSVDEKAVNELDALVPGYGGPLTIKRRTTKKAKEVTEDVAIAGAKRFYIEMKK